jgi:hypothetical protein
MINPADLRTEGPMRNTVALVLLAATTNCVSSDPTLTAERAASLIADLDGFQREAHFTLHTGAPLRSAFTCLSQAEVERAPLNQFAVGQGWARYETRNSNFGLGGKASCPAMTLTPAGESASATWTRGRAASGEGVAWMIPIGRRELLGVKKLSEAPDGSTQVEFEWKWTPNDTGTGLRKAVVEADSFFAQARPGRASCRQSDDGWRCQLGMWSPADALAEFRP